MIIIFHKPLKRGTQKKRDTNNFCTNQNSCPCNRGHMRERDAFYRNKNKCGYSLILKYIVSAAVYFMVKYISSVLHWLRIR